MNLIPAFIHRRIAHRPNLVKIVNNIGWLFFDKILRMGVGLLVGVWVARHLGPEQFGLLNFALAFTGLFGAIATVGLQGIVVRDIVRAPESARLTLGTAAILQLAGGVVSFLLILGTIAYLRPDDALSRTIVAILGAMVLLKASEIAVYWFESQVQSKYIVWVQNGVFLIFAAVKVALILNHAPLLTFVWAMLAEAALAALLIVIVMSRHGHALAKLTATLERAKTLLKDSWPLILSAIAVSVYMKIGQIMLGQMIGDEAVGIYSAAVKISEVWYFIPMVIVASVFPAILSAKENGEAQYCAHMQKLYDLLVIVSCAVAIPMSFLAEPVVVFLFGEKYVSAGPVLAIHIWALFFVALGVSSGKSLIAEGMQLLALKRNLWGAILNIGLNIVFIPRYQAAGAAIASFISYGFAYYLSDAIDKKTKCMFLQKTRAFLYLTRNVIIFCKYLARLFK